MNTHKGARLSPYSRALLVKRITCEGLRAEEAAQAAGVSVRTAYKWLQRLRKEGPSGLMNRSSRPHCCPHATAMAQVARVIERRCARQTYRTIARDLGMAPGRKTVAAEPHMQAYALRDNVVLCAISVHFVRIWDSKRRLCALHQRKTLAGA